MAKDLVFICEKCGTEYDAEWLLCREKSEEGKFICPCAYDGNGEQLEAYSVFAIKEAS